ncbi:hypothetical protein U9M48_031736 [Paspalum notatum var. saurae]|uniref:Uncharacterized protein n=1 Tax=Paspalum notatum var. saurae TaxID=547442 RepID=A0AAQ3U5V5_PASNO
MGQYFVRIRLVTKLWQIMTVIFYMKLFLKCYII